MEKEPDIIHTQVLHDNHGRIHNYLRLSLTDRCNLRCSYCMPTNPVFLPHPKILTVNQIDQLIDCFVNLGIKKIRLTGGEPLVRPDFDHIVRRIARYNIPLHLTTNATLLHKHIDLLAKNFKSVNISLDTLKPERFKSIAQRGSFKTVLHNLDLSVKHKIPTKLNMVVIRDVNHDEIIDFIRLTLEHPLEVRFIEFMPFQGNQWKFARSYSQTEILNDIESEFVIEPLKGKAHDTAQKFKVKDAPGSFGIISTVSHPFCNSCNRLRVTADGRLKNCLFSNNEFNLKPHLHNRVELETAIRNALNKKHKQYGGNAEMYQLDDTRAYQQNRTMTSIGG